MIWFILSVAFAGGLVTAVLITIDFSSFTTQEEHWLFFLNIAMVVMLIVGIVLVATTYPPFF